MLIFVLSFVVLCAFSIIFTLTDSESGSPTPNRLLLPQRRFGCPPPGIAQSPGSQNWSSGRHRLALASGPGGPRGPCWRVQSSRTAPLGGTQRRATPSGRGLASSVSSVGGPPALSSHTGAAAWAAAPSSSPSSSPPGSAQLRPQPAQTLGHADATEPQPRATTGNHGAGEPAGGPAQGAAAFRSEGTRASLSRGRSESWGAAGGFPASLLLGQLGGGDESMPVTACTQEEEA